MQGPPADPPSSWPGYVWWIRQSPMKVVLEIASSLRYWQLKHDERLAIRERLGKTTEQIVELQEMKVKLREARRVAALQNRATSSGRTDPPATGSTRTSSGYSPPR